MIAFQLLWHFIFKSSYGLPRRSSSFPFLNRVHKNFCWVNCIGLFFFFFGSCWLGFMLRFVFIYTTHLRSFRAWWRRKNAGAKLLVYQLSDVSTSWIRIRMGLPLLQLYQRPYNTGGTAFWRCQYVAFCTITHQCDLCSLACAQLVKRVKLRPFLPTHAILDRLFMPEFFMVCAEVFMAWSVYNEPSLNLYFEQFAPESGEEERITWWNSLS